MCVSPDPFDPEELARIEQAEAALAAIRADRLPGCGACKGTGQGRMMVGGRLSDWVDVRCSACDGSGEGRRAA